MKHKLHKEEQMKGFRSEFNPTKLANLLPLLSLSSLLSTPLPTKAFIILLLGHLECCAELRECCAELPVPETLVNYHDEVALAL